MSVPALQPKHTESNNIWEAIRELSQAIPFDIVESNLDKTCKSGWKAALKACQKGDWVVLQSSKAPLATLTSHWGKSLLTYSIRQREQEWATQLIAHKINLLSRDSEENTALHLAAQTGNLPLIESLALIGIDAQNHEGKTPLHLAVENGQVGAVKTLIEKGANPQINVKVGQMELNALGLAIMRDQKAVIDVLTETKRCDLNQPFPGVGNLLHLAIFFHKADLLKYLLHAYRGDISSQIESKDQEGLTPLSLAASLGEVVAMGILIHHRAAVDAKDLQGRLPVHHAALGCHADCIQLLAHYGAKLNPTDQNRHLPIDLLKSQEGEEAELCVNLIENFQKSKEAKKALPTPHLLPPQNLVFRGGGPKGIAYVGALASLHEQKLLGTVERIAGTSAGAITATLLAINYPIDKLETLLKETNLMSFLDHPLSAKQISGEMNKKNSPFAKALKTTFTVFQKLANPVGTLGEAIKSLYRCTGLCEGESFREWFEEIIFEQTKTIEKVSEDKNHQGIRWLTFGELAKLIETGEPYKHLVVFGTRIDKNRPEIVEFSSMDPTWKDVIISDAIRISMSIPGIFKPHIIHIKLNGQRIPAAEHGQFLDGGMLNNFPIETFDRKRFLTRSDLGKKANDLKYNPRTLGFTLYSSLESEPSEPNKVDTVGKLIWSIAKVYSKAENAIRKLHSDNSDRVIEIDVKDVGTLSFNMKNSKKDELVSSGREATEGFLESRHLVELPPLMVPEAAEIAFGPEVWGKHFEGIGQLPPIPQEMDAFLKAPCLIWPGKKRFQTHIAVCIPKMTLKEFVEKKPKTLDASPFRIDPEVTDLDQIVSETDQAYWIAFTRNTIPGCYNKTYEERCEILEQYPGYEPPTLLEAAICTSLEYLENDQKLFNERQPSWMRWTQCVEEDEYADTLAVGNFDEDGIGIFSYPGKRYGGLVGVYHF